MSKANSHVVKSAKRVLEVLEYFGGDRPSGTVTDISRELGYPQSSASVLLRCLRELGYLYYDRFERTYRLTARAGLLGCWAEHGNYRGGRMIEVMDAVALRVGETAVLSAGNVDYAIHHLHVVHGTAPGAVKVHTGETEPLLHSVQGNLMLAGYPDKQIRLALHRLNADEQDPERRVNIQAKLDELRALRARGWHIGSNSNGTASAVSVRMPRKKGGDRIILSVMADCGVIEEEGNEILRVILEKRDRKFGTGNSRIPDLERMELIGHRNSGIGCDLDSTSEALVQAH